MWCKDFVSWSCRCPALNVRDKTYHKLDGETILLPFLPLCPPPKITQWGWQWEEGYSRGNHHQRSLSAISQPMKFPWLEAAYLTNLCKAPVNNLYPAGGDKLNTPILSTMRGRPQDGARLQGERGQADGNLSMSRRGGAPLKRKWNVMRSFFMHNSWVITWLPKKAWILTSQHGNHTHYLPRGTFDITGGLKKKKERERILNARTK